MRTLFVLGASLSFVVGSAMAQQRPAEGWITVSEPESWSDDLPHSAAAGAQVRVVGQAYHPQGIERVTVGTQQAQITRSSSGVVDFVVTLNVASGQSDVRIEARALGGQIVTKTLKLTVTGGRPAGPANVSRPPATQPMYSPGSAMLRSLFIPGLGQFYTKRPVLGVAFLGAAGAAIGLAVASKKTTVFCTGALVNGECPSSQIAFEESEKPMLVPGLAGFAAVAVIAAFEASSAARRANSQRAGGDNNNGLELSLVPASLGNGRYSLTFLRTTF